MKNINKLILFCFLVKLLYTAEPPTIYDQLTCGKKNTKKPKDCTKYGTGSGMVCCWISDLQQSKGICRLVPDQTARDQDIHPSNKFEDAGINDNQRYWDCGNKGNYLYFNLVIVLLFLFLL